MNDIHTRSMSPPVCGMTNGSATTASPNASIGAFDPVTVNEFMHTSNSTTSLDEPRLSSIWTWVIWKSVGADAAHTARLRTVSAGGAFSGWLSGVQNAATSPFGSFTSVVEVVADADVVGVTI